MSCEARAPLPALVFPEVAPRGPPPLPASCSATLSRTVESPAPRGMDGALIIPGPAGAIQDDDAAGEGVEDFALAQWSDGAANGTLCEVDVLVACGYFKQPSWRALCAAIDVGEEAEEGAEQATLCSLAAVNRGDFDFQVPQLAGVVERLARNDDADASFTIVDPTGRIDGFFHPKVMQAYGASLAVGASVLLQRVTLYVSGPGTQRHLNVHPDCVASVFVTPPPDAEDDDG